MKYFGLRNGSHCFEVTVAQPGFYDTNSCLSATVALTVSDNEVTVTHYNCKGLTVFPVDYGDTGDGVITGDSRLCSWETFWRDCQNTEVTTIGWEPDFTHQVDWEIRDEVCTASIVSILDEAGSEVRKVLRVRYTFQGRIQTCDEQLTAFIAAAALTGAFHGVRATRGLLAATKAEVAKRYPEAKNLDRCFASITR